MPPPGMPPAVEGRLRPPKRLMTMPPAGMPPSGTVPPGMPPAEERLPPPRLVGSVASQIRQLNSVAPHGQPAAPLGPAQISAEAPERRQQKKTTAGRKEEDLWSRRVEMQWLIEEE